MTMLLVTISFLVFFLGAALASFITNGVERWANGDQFISGRSRCNQCGHDLTTIDLIPVFNYLYLRGRCRHCKKRFSPKSFFAELITGLLFLLSLWQLELSPELVQVGTLETDFIWRFLFLGLIICILLTISLYDIDHYLILDRFTYPASLLILVLQLVMHRFDPNLLGEILLAAVVNTSLLLAIFLATKGRGLGLGDVKLAGLIGLMTNLPINLMALVIATFIGAAFGLLLIALKKRSFGQAIPFGPFLSLGAIFALLYGQPLLDWYLNLVIV